MSFDTFIPDYHSYGSQELKPTFRVRRVEFGDATHSDSAMVLSIAGGRRSRTIAVSTTEYVKIAL